MKARLLLVWAVLISGCADAEPDRRPDSPLLARGWGLGLDMSDPPEPGPYRENASQVQALFDFLTKPKSSTWLDECEGGPNATQIASSLANDGLGTALRQIDDQCAARPPGTSVADDSGASPSHYNERLAEATLALARERNALDEAVGRIGSVVDAEFVSAMIGLHDWNRVIYAQSNDGFEQYNPVRPPEFEVRPVTNTRGPPPDNRQDLFLALDLLETIPRSVALHEAQLATYPWSDRTCKMPALRDLFERIARLRDEALALARTHADTDEFHHSWLQNYFNDDPSRSHDFTYLASNGWWPGLLANEMSLHHSIAYWRAYDDEEPLPNLEEAGFIVAEFLAVNHTLATRDHASTDAASIRPESDPDGHTYLINPERALHIRVLRSVPWTFGSVACT